MRVAIGEEVIKGVANEIGFISAEGDRGRSCGIRGSGGEIKFVGEDRRGGEEEAGEAGLAIFLKGLDLSSPLNASRECRSGIKRENARIIRMDSDDRVTERAS